MSINNKTVNKEKSSKKVAKFLSDNHIHKKDFAQMIGVTLSYIYNLIDENIPFSSRGITLERIATVMDIIPEDFEEYIIKEDDIVYDNNIQKIKDQMKKINMKTIDFLKHFERKKRLYLVDILRGSKALPADFYELYSILNAIKMKDDEIFEIWKDGIVNHLNSLGFNSEKNNKLLSRIFECAKQYIKEEKNQ